MSVASVGNSNEIKQSQRLDTTRSEARAQTQLDTSRNEDIEARRHEAERLMATGGNMQALMQELQARQIQTGGGPANNNLSQDDQIKVDRMVSTYLSQLQQQAATTLNASNQQRNDDANQSQMGSFTSRQSAGDDDADMVRITKAATEGIYRKLYELVTKMENTRKTKMKLSDIEAYYDHYLAQKGDGPFKVAIYEFNEKTGELKQIGTKELSKEEIKNEKQKISNDKDALSEMSQQDQLVLQQAMEQKSQFEQIFSNLQKSSDTGQNNIVANVK